MPRYIKILTHPVSTLCIGAILASCFGLLFDQDFGESAEEHIVGIVTVFATLSAAFFALQGPLLQIEQQKKQEEERRHRRQLALLSATPSLITELIDLCRNGIEVAHQDPKKLKDPELKRIYIQKTKLKPSTKEHILKLIEYSENDDVSFFYTLLASISRAEHSTEAMLTYLSPAYDIEGTPNYKKVAINVRVAVDWLMADWLTRHLFELADNDVMPTIARKDEFRLYEMVQHHNLSKDFNKEIEDACSSTLGKLDGVAFSDFKLQISNDTLLNFTGRNAKTRI